MVGLVSLVPPVSCPLELRLCWPEPAAARSAAAAAVVTVVVDDGGNGYTAGPRPAATLVGVGVIAFGNGNGMLCGRDCTAETAVEGK